MAETETKVKVSAKTDGFDKASQQAAKLGETQKAIYQQQAQNTLAATKAIQAHKKALGDLSKELKGVTQAWSDTKDAMKGVKEGTEIYKQLESALKDTEQKAGDLVKKQNDINEAIRKEKEAMRGATAEVKQHTQAQKENNEEAKKRKEQARGSFTQGYLQGSGFGEYLERGPGMYRQAAGRWLGQNTLGAARQVGGGLLNTPFNGIGGLATAVGGIPIVGGFAAAAMQNAAGMAGSALQYNAGRLRASPFLDPEQDNAGRLRAVGANGRQTSTGYNRIREAASYGMDMNELTGFESGLAQMQGGRGINTRNLKSFMEARAGFGVDEGTLGAFARGGRKGGTGIYSAGGSLTDSLEKAVSLGLEGSEVNEYLATIADGISNFEQTGIRLDPAAFTSMTKQLVGTTGLGQFQSQRLAGTLQARGNAISSSGPQDAVDVMMLRAAGFKGGGADDLLSAKKNLEHMDAATTKTFLQNITKSTGGGATGSMAFQSVLGKLGFNQGATQSDKMFRALTGKLEEGEQYDLDADIAKMTQGEQEAPGAVGRAAAGFRARAKKGGIARQASIGNEQIGIGQNMIGVVQNLESMTNQSAKAFTAFAPALKSLTTGMLDLSKNLPDIANKIVNLFGGDSGATTAVNRFGEAANKAADQLNKLAGSDHPFTTPVDLNTISGG